MAALPTRPLAKADWFARLRDLAVSCFACFDDEQDEPIRRMLQLVHDAPDAQWIVGLLVPDELEFECMLGAGYYETAVRSFFSSETGLMLARGDDGAFLATVVLPSGHQAEAVADTPALALVGALASVLAGTSDPLAVLDAVSHPLREAA